MKIIVGQGVVDGGECEVRSDVCDKTPEIFYKILEIEENKSVQVCSSCHDRNIETAYWHYVDEETVDPGILDIFEDAERMPASGRKGYGPNYDIALNHEGRGTKTYTPPNPEDGYK